MGLFNVNVSVYDNVIVNNNIINVNAKVNNNNNNVLPY